MNNNKILNMLREEKETRLKGRLYYSTQIQFSYNTNHIEGSRLTAEQTKYIYETNTLVTENSVTTSIDDIFETINHFKMFDYMLDVAEQPLSQDIVKKFHKILKSGTADERKPWFRVGDYKILSNEIDFTETTPPDKVAEEMKSLIKSYNEINNVLFENIVEFHSDFEKIHPFQDGNGRVGRMIMFKECLKNNITPFIILDKDKYFYYRGLREYRTAGGENGYLIETCRNAQDQYKALVDKFMPQDMAHNEDATFEQSM
ncbi:MAG: Fic family protein [Clostridiales bacterium]|nr:Fic family protein [Clostridiales bacterium]